MSVDALAPLTEILDTCAENGVPPIPRGDVAEAVFTEPWQAEAFATAVQLSARGLFTWPEWVEVFAAEIAGSPQTEGEDAADAYFRQWLAALETIVTDRGKVTAADVVDAHEHWRRSYVNTEHGQPVTFSRGWDPISSEILQELEHHHHHHGHAHKPKPITVSAASTI